MVFDYLVSDDHDDFICVYCFKILPRDIKALTVHGRKCSQVDRPTKLFTYVCSKCGYNTQYNSHFTDHIKKHLKYKKHGCPFCPFKARTNSNVKSHMVYKHSDVERKECPFCKFSSKMKSQLKFHMNRKHADLIENVVIDFESC
uniref:Zinc finger protein 407 n=1 Tax=Cacopsylla melanoneura TaxID=428564 RepID=A0A8D8Q736_9HEMI